MRQDEPGNVTPAPTRAQWWILPALVAGGVVIGAFAWLIIGGAQHTAGWGYDFRAYYDAALRLLHTGTPYQPETLSGPFRPGPGGLYLYSPVPAWLLEPATWLSVDSATLAWLVLRLTLLVAACALMPVQKWVRVATLVVALASAQFLYDLNLGNVSLIVTFLAVVAWRWLDAPLSGLSIAASLTIRPTMGVIWVWWLVRRQWRAAAWTVLGFGVIVLASLPFIGSDPWFQFVSVLRNLTDVMGVGRNLDLGSTALSLGMSETAGLAALVAGYVIAIAAVAVSLRRDREISFAVTLMATLLLSPLLWNHYLTNLIVPAALLASRGRRWGLLLPLLGWLPEVLLPFVVVAGMVAPFLAPNRGPGSLRGHAGEAQPIADVDPSTSDAAVSQLDHAAGAAHVPDHAHPGT